MTAPTLLVRHAVYQRDGARCVACGAAELTFQHRRAVGTGGSKLQPPPVDGLALCGPCNEACEHGMQTEALAYGWKVRRWANPERVPVFYPLEFAWHRLEGVGRVKISSMVAFTMMCAVYGGQWVSWWEQVKQ